MTEPAPSGRKGLLNAVAITAVGGVLTALILRVVDVIHPLVLVWVFVIGGVIVGMVLMMNAMDRRSTDVVGRYPPPGEISDDQFRAMHVELGRIQNRQALYALLIAVGLPILGVVGSLLLANT